MKTRVLIPTAAAIGLLFAVPGWVDAQAMLADDIVIISKGQREQEKARTSTHLGNTPGAGDRAFRADPGGGESKLGEPPGGAVSFAPMQRRDVLSAASSEGRFPARAAGGPRLTRPAQQPGRQAPIYGTLDPPQGRDDGPPDGLTLDQAIARLLQVNYSLRTKFQEIPKADADILSAGLRANPLVFGSADSVPYGNYSRQRPGNNSYSVVLIQPIDVNQKRKVRVLVAQQARKVLDAQYQDAVRLEIDNLDTAFVDVLDAREAFRYARASVDGLDRVLAVTKQQ